MRVTTCLVLLPPSFVVNSLQIAADMRLVHASLGAKTTAASRYLNFLPPPWRGLCVSAARDQGNGEPGSRLLLASLGEGLRPPHKLAWHGRGGARSRLKVGAPCPPGVARARAGSR